MTAAALPDVAGCPRGGGAARDGKAVRTPLLLLAADRRRARRAHPRQGGMPAAHRLVQIPRRLQRAVAARSGEAPRRGRRLLLRQSCARRRRGGAAPRHAGDDRDAGRCAGDQGREHALLRRRDRALRSLSREPRGNRAAHRRRPRRRDPAAVRRCPRDRRPRHDRTRNRRRSAAPGLDASTC